MEGGVHGATGVRVPNLVAKASWEGGDSATALRHPTVAASAWDRQIKHCLVTKANVQVSQIKNRIENHEKRWYSQITFATVFYNLVFN